MKLGTMKFGAMIAGIICLAWLAACQQQDGPQPPAAVPVEAEQPPTEIPPTPIVADLMPTNPPPTVTTAIMTPTPTLQSAAATNPPPTTLPSTVEVEIDTNQENSNENKANSMNIQIGDHDLTATLVDNSSVDALKEALSEGPITVNMRDYESMEKVGSLGMDLPRNDQQITTEAGDIILFQGSALVIYYAPNSWIFTRLGKINDVNAEELREILGDGSVTITLSLPEE